MNKSFTFASMNNTRFATSIHIMTILAKDPQDWFTSDWIAGSININPVIVRKELIILKKYGLVESKLGKDGGVRIAKNKEEISISEIYNAVKNSEVLGKKNQNPNPKCTIGKDINKNLDSLFSEIDHLVEEVLSNKSLGNFTKQFE